MCIRDRIIALLQQARVEVHGALEAARELELELNEERQKLKQQQRMLENEKWRLQEIESDLSVRAQHMDSLVQVGYIGIMLIYLKLFFINSVEYKGVL